MSAASAAKIVEGVEVGYTPGPWVSCGAVTPVGVVPDMLWVGEINPSGKFRGAIARVQSADHIDDGISREEAAANACLLAAAPDLLEALQAVVAVADRKTDEFDRARAAIAKAKGAA